MITRVVDIPTTPTSVASLVGLSQKTWEGIFFQALEDNPDTVNFGDPSIQPHELRPQSNGYLPVSNSNSLVFVAPGSGNQVAFSFF